MRRILLTLVIIAATSTLAFSLTKAFFSDTETSTGNIFQAGMVDLKVDNTSYYNGELNVGTTWESSDLPGHLFFNFLDLKPSDNGEDTISLHVQNDAWACMDIQLTKNDDNTCTEPEQTDDPTCSEPDVDLLDGELAQNINFAFWADDGDNVLETGEQIFKQGTALSLFDGQTWTLADSISSIWTPSGPLPANVTRYIGKYWCLGTLTPAPAAPGAGDPTVNSGFTCDGSALNNASQTDVVMADVEFTAIQSRNNPNFLCNPSPTPTPLPSPTPVACIEGFASSSSNNNQGTRKDGSAILADRTVPSAMFGAPQTSGLDSDVGIPAGSFFSLGFTGGNIVVGFTNPFFPNPIGPDLQVFEVTGGVYPDEKVKVEVGPSAAGPWTLVSASATRDEDLELPGSVLSAQFVRLTDVSDISLFPNDADAYDVDAIKALCTTTPNN